MFYQAKSNNLRFIISEQPIELSLVKIGILIKTFLHYCVVLNSKTH